MPTPDGKPLIGYEEQASRCLAAGPLSEKHPMIELLSVTKEDGNIHKALVCPGCGAHALTVTDKDGLLLTPIIPFTWPKSLLDRLDQMNRR
ncbi:MAG TPA: hypothetical protein VJ579_03900 [Candidatus Paceibacterota bacterium]|nr:hypothetical protein [Candidatus Paceibacterota bacterium]